MFKCKWRVLLNDGEGEMSGVVAVGVGWGLYDGDGFGMFNIEGDGGLIKPVK